MYDEYTPEQFSFARHKNPMEKITITIEKENGSYFVGRIYSGSFEDVAQGLDPVDTVPTRSALMSDAVTYTLQQAKRVAEVNESSTSPLSQVQQHALLQGSCPKCSTRLHVVGDLADFDHDIVQCKNYECDYVLFADGSAMHD
jgi:hypothetical protein